MLLNIPPICLSSLEVPSLVMGVQYDIRVLLRNANDIGFRDVGTGKKMRQTSTLHIDADVKTVFLTHDPPIYSVVTAVPIYKPSRAAVNIRLLWMSTSQLTVAFDPPAGIDTPTHYKAIYSMQYENGTYAPEFLSDEVTAPVTEGITINGLEFNRLPSHALSSNCGSKQPS